MREIKFRAWYEKEKRFLSWDELQDGTESLQTYFNNELSDVSPLMQYTGLKDKNGKEIYEGDILSTDLSRPYLIVCFRNGAFMVQCHDDGKDYYDLMVSINEESDQVEHLEVIGNIYENPELLEESK